MLKEEATWIYSELENLSASTDLFPVGNIGSSDEKQLSTQPWVRDVLIEPLKKLGSVFNVDIKQGPDIDYCGDLLDARFIEKLKAAGFNSILCANIHTNISKREDFSQSLLDILPKNGYLVVTTSNLYPFVADPIDTEFRPSVEELHALFPNTEIVTSEMIESISYAQFLVRNPGVLAVTFFRLITPFYKFQHWKKLVGYAPNFFKNFKTTCLILKKCN